MRTPVFLVFTLTLAAQQRPSAPAPRGLPDGPGKDAVVRVCGSSCHGPQIISGKGYTPQGWTAVTNAMIARGAKATPEETNDIVEYLAKNLPPRSGTAGAGGVGFIGAGPDDAHVVDVEAAGRGKAIYAAECVSCHGPKGRGVSDGVPPAQRGADIVRSLVVLKDRYGATIGDFMKRGHPMQSGKPSASIVGSELQDLSHFLHQKVTDTLRNGPYSQVINVLTGDAKAGEAYFHGAGGCVKCHDAKGDLAGVGSKYDPPTLQQKFLFPRAFGRGVLGPVKPPKPVLLTVTTQDGKTFKGTLVHLDDFNASLRDSSGEYYSWRRTPALKVTKEDPYAGHNALLDQYTDKNMHDIVAYLEKLK
ncbi:MAG: c-type cytochrome [Acidobacteria bacterium]|nr:c-type cytochrome [Acidobacteriota bacterium]